MPLIMYDDVLICPDISCFYAPSKDDDYIWLPDYPVIKHGWTIHHIYHLVMTNIAMENHHAINR